MKESKPLSGFEPTAVRGKWFEFNVLNHLATDALDLLSIGRAALVKNSNKWYFQTTLSGC
jgi:hypothetical protein